MRHHSDRATPHHLSLVLVHDALVRATILNAAPLAPEKMARKAWSSGAGRGTDENGLGELKAGSPTLCALLSRRAMSDARYVVSRPINHAKTTRFGRSLVLAS